MLFVFFCQIASTDQNIEFSGDHIHTVPSREFIWTLEITEYTEKFIFASFPFYIQHFTLRPIYVLLFPVESTSTIWLLLAKILVSWWWQSLCIPSSWPLHSKPFIHQCRALTFHVFLSRRQLPNLWRSWTTLSHLQQLDISHRIRSN